MKIVEPARKDMTEFVAACSAIVASSLALGASRALAPTTSSEPGRQRQRQGPRQRPRRRTAGGSLMIHAADPASDADPTVDNEALGDHVRGLVAAANGTPEIGSIARMLAAAPYADRARIGAAIANASPRVAMASDPETESWLEFHRTRMREIAVNAPEAPAEDLVSFRCDVPMMIADAYRGAFDRALGQARDRSALMSARDEVAAEFRKFLRKCHGEAVLAGGSVVRMVMHKPPSDGDEAPLVLDDLDLCVYGGAKMDELEGALRSLVAGVGHDLRDMYQAYLDLDESDRCDALWSRERGVTELRIWPDRDPYDGPVIQLNSSSASARSVSDVLLGFDRAACAFAYDAEAERVVALRRATHAHAAGEEPADLVFGSGDARACVRTAVRDAKYLNRHGVATILPPALEAAVDGLCEHVLRDLLIDLRTAFDEIARLHPDDIGDVTGKLPRLPQDRKLASRVEHFARDCASIMWCAPAGLVTTLVVRFGLAEFGTLLGTESVHTTSNFGQPLHRDSVTPPPFMSRKYRRVCDAVRDLPAFTGPVASDLCVWLDLVPVLAARASRLAREVRSTAPADAR